MQELKQQVLDWATEKGITKPENASRQFLKLIEEYGEFHEGLLEDDRAKLGDAIGDCYVVAIILAEQTSSFLNVSKRQTELLPAHFSHMQINLSRVAEALAKNKSYGNHLQEFIDGLEHVAIDRGFNPKEELEKVLAIITKRKGTTVNGVFIKDEP